MNTNNLRLFMNRKIKNDSLGIECLDDLVGIGTGATILHSLILMDENRTNGRYVTSIKRCFIAEGYDQNNDLFIAGASQEKILNILQKLPKKCEKNQSEETITSLSNYDFKIAWRYKNVLPYQTSNYKNHSTAENPKFDLSNVDPDFNFQKANEDWVFNFNGEQPSLSSLWNVIYQKITNPIYAINQKNAQTIRIVLSDLSAPIWSDLNYLPLFLAHLKSYSRHANMIVLISLDSLLLNNTIYNNCIQYTDVIFQLQKMEHDEQIKLHLRHRIDGGRFFVHKLPTIVSTAPIHFPLSIDLLFSLRKNFFEIKTLHLPPAIGEDNKKTSSKMACQLSVEF